MRLPVIIESLRPAQWIKNLAVLAAVILNGQLFNQPVLLASLAALIAFCLFSSASYLINDIIDIDKDRIHPIKKNRPIARGDLAPSAAATLSILLLLSGLSLSINVSPGFFLLSLFFCLLQFGYTFFLKKKAVLDIIGIATFFIIRAFAGEIASGYHLPVWIMLTVIFLSLFIASGKRRSELINTGSKTRNAIRSYSRSVLNFYTTMFAVCTLVTYAMFTFFEEPIRFQGLIHNFLLDNFPAILDRKWYMVTLFPVIFGIMRYGQIIFEMQEGERPERLVATDIPLIFSVLLWGMMIITLVYVL